MLAARISGDRFARVRRRLDARRRADHRREPARRRSASLDFVSGPRTVDVSASFGVARVVDGKHPLSHALAAAEIACKAAKDRGRDRVEIYEDADQSIVRRYTDVTLVGTLRYALAQDRFRLEAQPIVPLNGAVAGAEVRAAAAHDRRGRRRACRRRSSSRRRSATSWRRPSIAGWCAACCRRSSRTPRSWPRRGACFAVNISGQSLGDADFCAFLEGALRESGLPPSLLSFELTETAAVANIVRAETLMRRLRELGFDVALDDFGRGLSSLTYLKTLPVTCLKIDGSFVRDVVGDDRSQAMLSAIVRLAEAMGLSTVAECVESDADPRHRPPASGSNYGQGFSIGRPEAARTGDPGPARRYYLRPVRSVEATGAQGHPHTARRCCRGPARRRRDAGARRFRRPRAARRAAAPPAPPPSFAARGSHAAGAQRIRRQRSAATSSTAPRSRAWSPASTRTPRSSTPPSTRRCGSAPPATTPASGSRSPSRTAGSWSSRRSRVRRPTGPACGRATCCSRSTARRSKPAGSTKPSSACAASSARTCAWRSAATASPNRCSSSSSAPRCTCARCVPSRCRAATATCASRISATRRRATSIGSCRELQAAAPLAGLVLDLRGNPGGVLESAVSVADDFLEPA